MQEKERKKAAKEAELKRLKEIKHNFVGLSIGISTLSAKFDSTKPEDTSPSTKGTNINLNLGRKLTTSTFTTLSYSHIMYDDITLTNYLASYNYLHTKGIYAGVLAGISSIKLEKSPNNTYNNLSDKIGNQYAYGVQVGYEKKITANYTFVINYQYLLSKHTTKLSEDDTTVSLERDNHSSISVGVRWLF